MPCFCGRATRGFGYDNREFFDYLKKTYWFCSMQHMKIFKQHYEKEKKELDLSKIEKDAIEAAHKFVGEWLKEKGTANLRELSVTDQYQFMGIVYGNICAELSRLEAERRNEH